MAISLVASVEKTKIILVEGHDRLKRYFKPKQLVELREGYDTIRSKTDRLILSYVYYPFTNDKAKEYAQQGFSRRVQVLRRCIENVFKAVRPGTIKVPPKERLYDAQINIQAFLTNAYGSVDNLAWVWVHERGLATRIRSRQVGLRKHNTEVRATFSSEFQNYLEGLEDWFGYITNYRDALAHRIPLYIPPGMVRPKDVDAYNDLSKPMSEAMGRIDPVAYDRLSVEQNNLLVFQPLMAHAISEASPFVFHVQLLADFLTIEKLGEKMLSELQPG